MKPHDNYPSRVSANAGYQFMPRLEPVCSGGSGWLSQEQLNQYDANGFLLIEDFFAVHLADMSKEADRLFKFPPVVAALNVVVIAASYQFTPTTGASGPPGAASAS